MPSTAQKHELQGIRSLTFFKSMGSKVYGYNSAIIPGPPAHILHINNAIFFLHTIVKLGPFIGRKDIEISGGHLVIHKKFQSGSRTLR